MYYGIHGLERVYQLLCTRETAAFGGVSLALGGSADFGGVSAQYKNIWRATAPQMVLTLPHGHEGSEYVLSYEIGQQEGGFYSGRT